MNQETQQTWATNKKAERKPVFAPIQLIWTNPHHMIISVWIDNYYFGWDQAKHEQNGEKKVEFE